MNKMLKELHQERMARIQPTFRDVQIDEKISITICEKSGMEIGSSLWPASFAISKYFSERNRGNDSGFFKDKTVLELGAGVGLAGVCAAVLGAKVTLTDRKSVLPILRKTVAKNANNTVNHPEVLELDWGKGIQTKSGSCHSSTFDFIIGADILYVPEQALHFLLDELLRYSSEKTEIIIAFQLRYGKELTFLNAARAAGFSLKRIQGPDVSAIMNNLCSDGSSAASPARKGSRPIKEPACCIYNLQRPKSQKIPSDR